VFLIPSVHCRCIMGLEKDTAYASDSFHLISLVWWRDCYLKL
jgi:hypothetical protein